MVTSNLAFCSATPEDSSVIAQMIYLAAPRMTDYTLKVSPAESVEYIAYCVRENIGFYGYQYQYVARTEERVVLTVTLYDSRRFRRLVWESVVSAWKYFGFRHALGIWARTLTIAGLFEPPPKNSLFMANLCVQPDFQGLGVFQTVFRRHILGTAMRLGVNSIELDVGIDNPRARKLYSSLGFKVKAEHPYKGKADIIGVARMVFNLLY